MDFNVIINGREPKPRIINVKQYASNTDRVIFTFDSLPFLPSLPEQGVCYLLWGGSHKKLTLEGSAAIWDISQAYTQERGCFNFQLKIESESSDKTWLSDLMLLIVSESLENGEELKESVELKGNLIVNGVVENAIKGEAKTLNLTLEVAI